MQAKNASGMRDGPSHSQSSHGEPTLQQRRKLEGANWSPGTPKKQAAVQCMHQTVSVNTVPGTYVIPVTCGKLQQQAQGQLLQFGKTPRESSQR